MKTKSKIASKVKLKGSKKVKSKALKKTKLKGSLKKKPKEITKSKSIPVEKVKTKVKFEIKWLSLPEDHDYPASLSYLRLIYKDDIAEKIVADLKKAPVTNFKAKDIFRASELSLLGVSNSHVKSNRNKIKKGIKLSPIILVRDTTNGKVVIADGYHRLCAVYSFSEDLLIPCKII
jgi:hypothetical protein